MRIRAFAVASLSVVALSACGSPDTPADAPAATEQGVTADAPQETAPAVECEDVPARVTDFIAGGGEGAEIAVTRAAAYRSPNYEQVYFVAADFTAGGAPLTGVWVTNSIDPDQSGILMAADTFAQEFTVYPDAHTTDFAIPRASEDIDNARTCLDQMS